MRGDVEAWRTRTRVADSSFAVAWPAAWNSRPVYSQNIASVISTLHSAFCRHIAVHCFVLTQLRWHSIQLFF